jgi:hypothetical protein
MRQVISPERPASGMIQTSCNLCKNTQHMSRHVQSQFLRAEEAFHAIRFRDIS